VTLVTQSRPKVIEFSSLYPKQEEVWNWICDGEAGGYSICGWGGSVVAGKTGGLVRIAIMLAAMYPGIKIVIGRDSMVNLKGPGATMEQFYAAMPADGLMVKDGGIIRRKVMTNFPHCEIQLPGWPENLFSTVYFRQLDDFSFLRSTEFGALLCEEADSIPEGAWRFAITRLRQRLPDGSLPKYLALAVANPSISWFKEWFVDDIEQKKDDLEDDLGAAVRLHFFHAEQKDNPNRPENYERMLRAVLDDEEIAANVDGSFETVRGQIFSNFSPVEHALYQDCTRKPNQEMSASLNCHAPGPHGPHWDRRDTKTIILHGQYLTIPKFVRAVGGLDFAGANTKAHLSTGTISVIDKFGRDYLIDCFADNPGPMVHIRQREWMEHVEDALGLHRKVEWAADGTQSVGISYLRYEHGFNIVKNKGSDDAWRQSIQFIRERFRLDEFGIPKSTYLKTERNKKWVRQIQQYRVDMKQGPNGIWKDKAIEKDDDIYDAYRYQQELLKRILLEMFPPKPEYPDVPKPRAADDVFTGLEHVMAESRDRKLRERAVQMALDARKNRAGVA